MRTLLATLLCLTALAAPSYAADPAPLPTGTDLDYQLGGPAYVPDNVGIVVRDRTAEPATGVYNICYVNGFQTQPDAKRFWRTHRDLLLQDARGRLVEDEAWGEWLLDIRTPSKRARLASIVGRWTAGCARNGFDAVEYDNLDSFSRSRGLVKARHAKAFAQLLVAQAHDAGLAAGQKNWSEWDGTRAGFDFAVSEQCGRYDECGSYVDHYGEQVLVIEYRARDFAKTCRAYGEQLAVVLRDLDLSPDGVRRWC
ncbi:endo alpha-1,4 polygalactosaminidase [Nocardioides hwasunensis]|uniref:Endo alpha-1,4 polygalactosaminidase n=1 Tax=Nocardioides hwasunensis TaxID=397258 RepID=A0ABR8MK47_9ACTN|nr:endo alpha-1,4 polygalactosaminidase [Nocardioides hwasunensis]MBD3916406.1 endo alpha-1,4 polygalactosaminidase [Nocardioides hwasunensis]